jgi:hypothetical protein
MDAGGRYRQGKLSMSPTLSPVIQRMYNSLVWNDQERSINGS